MIAAYAMGVHASATTTSTARSGTSTSGSRRRSRRRARPATSARTSSAREFSLRAARAPRLRRLHLRRGNRAARVARGQEGPAALQAAVPGELRPVRQADHDQQHRDLRRGALDHAQRRRGVPRARQAEQRRHQALLGVRPRRAARQLRGALGTPFAKLLEMAGGMRGGRKLKAVIPGGSSMPVLPADIMMATDMDYDSIAKAGSMLGSGAVIVMDETRCMVQVAGAPVVLLLRGVLRPVHAVPRGHRLAVARGHRIEHGKGRPEDLDLLQSRRRQHRRAARSARWATPRRCRCKSFLKHFRDEFEHHIEHKRCLVPTLRLTHDRQNRCCNPIEIDGKPVEVPHGSTVMDAAQQARHLRAAFLLPQEAVDRGQLPHVPGAGGEGAQAAAGLRDAGRPTA